MQPGTHEGGRAPLRFAAGALMAAAAALWLAAPDTGPAAPAPVQPPAVLAPLSLPAPQAVAPSPAPAPTPAPPQATARPAAPTPTLPTRTVLAIDKPSRLPPPEADGRVPEPPSDTN